MNEQELIERLRAVILEYNNQENVYQPIFYVKMSSCHLEDEGDPTFEVTPEARHLPISFN